MIHKWRSGRPFQVKVTEWLNIYCKRFGATPPCFYGWWQRRYTWSRSTHVGLLLATQYTPKVVKLRHILRYCVSCAGQLQTAQYVAQHYVMRYTKSCKLRNIAIIPYCAISFLSNSRRLANQKLLSVPQTRPRHVKQYSVNCAVRFVQFCRKRDVCKSGASCKT